MIDAETAFYDAKQIANHRGYFIVVKPTVFLLFRKAEPKNVFVGARKHASGLLQLVKKVCVDSLNN